LPTHRAEAPGRDLSLAGLLGRIVSLGLILCLVVGLGIVLGPGVPAGWNPLAPLDPRAPHGLLTRVKLDRASATPEQCFATLEQLPDIRLARLLDREVSEQCHIRGHALVRGLGLASLDPVSTRCDTALRLALWETHSLQPAARRWLGTQVRSIIHFGSYSCRTMATEAGGSSAMSAHATARAIDIAGFAFDDGRSLSLQAGWRSRDAAERAFLREIRSGACNWFRTVLSPDFNSLHADHFHFAQGRYGACR